MALAFGSSRRLYVDDLRWIKDPPRLKDQLLNVVAQTEMLKHYISSAAVAGTGTRREVAGVSDTKMELHPAGLTFPLAFVYTSQVVATACKEAKSLFCKEGSDWELLACTVPLYPTNVSLHALRQIHNSCSGGGYQRQSDMDYFVDIVPNGEFNLETCEIEKRSGGKGCCKIFSRELDGPMPYDAILAIGKLLLK